MRRGGHAFVTETEGRVEVYQPILAGQDHAAAMFRARRVDRMAQYPCRVPVTPVVRVGVHAENHLPCAVRVVHLGMVVHVVEQMRLVGDHAVDETHQQAATGTAGAIGTLLAAFGLLNAFQGFLSLMSALIPPLAGVLIASYWIVGKGKRENFSPRPGFSAVGVISFAVGAVFACITGGTFASFPGLVEAMPFLNWPFFVGPVNGIVVSLVLYVGLAKLTSAKPMPAK